MSSAQKIIQAAAGNAAGEGLYVEEVFSTYLYEGLGNGGNVTVSNGVNLSEEGGLVWAKQRSGNGAHVLVDTVRGANEVLLSYDTSAEFTQSSISAFSTTGFTVANGSALVNAASQDYASWTFRKAPKFFDVVTWTGDGTSGKTVSHSLGSVPGSVVIKRTDSTSNWTFWHRSLTAEKFLRLNLTDAEVSAAFFEAVSGQGNVDPTDSVITLGNSSQVNASGGTYVAYLFAHNDDDGEFGEDADQDIIKCGSYTGNGSADGPEIDLGFEPQWLLIKSSSLSENWHIFDNMRGVATGGDDSVLYPNLTSAESTSSNWLSFTSTGFKITATFDQVNSNTNTYIYIAIRRGPMKTPESGTEVFDLHTSSPSVITTGFPVDAILAKYATSNWDFVPRLTEGSLATSTNSAEVDYSAYLSFASNTAFLNSGGAFNSSAANWCFRRAPGFFDVVAYPGSSSAKTVSHNLGVTPEMIIFKNRTDAINWIVYHKDTGSDSSVDVTELDTSDALRTSTAFFNSTQPTDSVFTVGTASHTNFNGRNYIAYLFATLPGISKVGSYTGNGTSQTIDCGFSAGARFVLIKRTDDGASWNLFDTERGIVAGNDARLLLNSSGAEESADYVDPDSSGFAVANPSQVNASGGNYIFLAIA